MTQPTDREVLARIICPHVKPWMDHPETVTRPCACGPVETPYGNGTPICLSQMLDIADAILAAGFARQAGKVVAEHEPPEDAAKRLRKLCLDVKAERRSDGSESTREECIAHALLGILSLRGTVKFGFATIALVLTVSYSPWWAVLLVAYVVWDAIEDWDRP